MLTVSFDPHDRVSDARAQHDAHGWSFFIATEPAILRLTETLGFRFRYDPKTDQFAHPSALFVVTGDGKLSRTLDGVGTNSRDLRLALVDASLGRFATLSDRVLLTCFRYDPASRRYGPNAFGFFRIAAATFVVFLASTLGFLFWRERRRRS